MSGVSGYLFRLKGLIVLSVFFLAGGLLADWDITRRMSLGVEYGADVRFYSSDPAMKITHRLVDGTVLIQRAAVNTAGGIGPGLLLKYRARWLDCQFGFAYKWMYVPDFSGAEFSVTIGTNLVTVSSDPSMFNEITRFRIELRGHLGMVDVLLGGDLSYLRQTVEDHLVSGSSAVVETGYPGGSVINSGWYASGLVGISIPFIRVKNFDSDISICYVMDSIGDPKRHLRGGAASVELMYLF
jgi:hypothetical protein